MAFWVEVKPGRPFIFHPCRGRRLHISQATLGKANLGLDPTIRKKIVVQCNVGDTTPVSICSLFPDKFESFQLNLEFEETVDVMFTVIGSHTVHLSGYYLPGVRQFDLDDNGTDTYGEDIANTETERSADGTDDDDYENSFINDDDDLGPPSPVPSAQVEDSLEERRPKHGKGGKRRLSKKYHVTDSDDECESQGKSFVIGKKSKGPRKEEIPHEVSDGDDLFFGNEVLKRDKALQSETMADRLVQNLPLINADDQKNENDIEDSKQDFSKPSADMVLENVAKTKKRKKKQVKEEKINETHNPFMMVIGEDKMEPMEEIEKRANDEEQQDEPKADNIQLDMPATDAETQKQANDKEDKTQEKQDEPKAENIQLDMPASDAENQKQANDEEDKTALQKDEPIADNVQLGMPTTNAESQKQENDEEDKVPKDEVNAENTEHDMPLTKKNQKLTNDGDDIPFCIIIGAVKALQYEAGTGNAGLVVPVTDEENMKQANDKRVVLACPKLGTENVARSKRKRKERANRILDNAVEQSADENHSEKKRKKKSKGIIEENREPSHMDSSVQSINEESRSLVDIEDNNSGDKSSQHRTLSNGLVIKELETGKTDGKIAAPGKKMTINYTGMLKDNGEVFESNVDGAPYTFRLGKGRVLEGLDIGIDGMRVGGKRRLIVPPPLGYGSGGEDVKNVPPDAWLVYDVELLHMK